MAATAAAVPSTVAASHHRGGRVTGPPSLFTAEYSPIPPGMPSSAPASAGNACAAASPALTCCAGRAQRPGQRRGVPGVQHRRPGDEDRVDRGQHDQHHRQDRHHLAHPASSGLFSPALRRANRRYRRGTTSTATMPVAVTATLITLSTMRRGRRAAMRSPNSSGTGSRAENAMIQALRRGGRAASASAPTVLVRAARMAGRTSRRPPRRAPRPPPSRPWSRSPAARPPPPTRPAPGPAISGAASQPPSRPSGGRHGQDQVLGQQHGGDQARRAADRLEQADASGLLGHPAADEHGDAGHREQAEQPAAGEQDSAARSLPARPSWR